MVKMLSREQKIKTDKQDLCLTSYWSTFKTDIVE